MGLSLQAAIDAGYEPVPPPTAQCSKCTHPCMRHEPYGGCHDCDCTSFWD